MWGNYSSSSGSPPQRSHGAPPRPSPPCNGSAPTLSNETPLQLLLHGPGAIPLQNRPSSPERLPRLPGLSSPAAGVAPMGAHLLALRTRQGELSSPSRIRPPRRRCEETPRAPFSLGPTGSRSTEPRAASAARVLRRVGPRRRHRFSLSPFPCPDAGSRHLCRWRTPSTCAAPAAGRSERREYR